ncbi:MAG: hypothetical protein IJR00_08550 [Lachnospiraceae bacterium]|nr:hypothetical protein [Lachnospiraceae bacterium]
MKAWVLFRSIMCVLLSVSILTSTVAVAHASEPLPIEAERDVEPLSPIDHGNRPPDAEIQSVGGVLLFIAGILVGYIIDGVIIYFSGHSAAELAAELIARIIAFFKKLNKTGVTRIYVSSDGTITSGGSNTCSFGAVYE